MGGTPGYVRDWYMYDPAAGTRRRSAIKASPAVTEDGALSQRHGRNLSQALACLPSAQ